MQSAEGRDRVVTVSVIVNTCDRVGPLRRLLSSLDEQTYEDFEVLVVVGPSHDGTRQMLESNFGGRVTVVECPVRNLCVSRNLGLVEARGDVVAFIDDDATATPVWLEQLVAAYQSDPSLAAVGGRTDNVRDGQLQFLRGYGSLLGEQCDVRRGSVADPGFESPPELWFPRLHGCNMSYRRGVLLSLGGFDERYVYLYDDLDLGARLFRTGERVGQLDDAVVYHAPASGFNRGRHPYDLNWFDWIRAHVYFTLKSAPDLGVATRLRWAARHIARLLSQVDEAREAGHMPAELAAKARRAIRRGATKGLVSGLFRSRQLARLREDRGEPSGAIRPFLGSNSDQPNDPAPGELSVRRAEVPNVSEGSERLRLVLLSADFPPENFHGVARHTRTLARALGRLGHEVHVIARGRVGRTAQRSCYLLHQVEPRGRARYDALARRGFLGTAARLAHSHAVHDKVLELVRNHGVQLVDSPVWNLDGLVTQRAGLLPSVVRIVTSIAQLRTLHQDDDPELALLAELEGNFLDEAQAVVCNSTASRATLESVHGLSIETERHPVVPFGEEAIEDERIEPLSGRSGEEVRALFVGRLEHRKGLPELLEALPAVLRKVPNLSIDLVGADNSVHDGSLERTGRTYPERLRADSSLRQRIRVHGHVDDAELERFYRDCDFLVAPSRYESFGLILIEAMNWARPVIACRAGGPIDIVEECVSGLLVEPAASSELATSDGDARERPRVAGAHGFGGPTALSRSLHRRANGSRICSGVPRGRGKMVQLVAWTDP